MKFLCKCGNIIHDTSDCLSYKGTLIADQDLNEFWDIIEKAEQPHDERIDIFLELEKLMTRNVYQCDSCGMVFIEDQSDKYKLVMFTPCTDGTPEPEVSRKLFNSAHMENWKGYLHADWSDKKPEWCEHNGYIFPILNIKIENTEFDEYEAFEKRFYELFEYLKGLDLITNATLTINGKRAFSWTCGKDT